MKNKGFTLVELIITITLIAIISVTIGVSMSGIAEILHNWGFEVTGSNNSTNENVVKLLDAGIEVKIGHNAENVVGSDIVVYTAAISKDNPELVHAQELGIQTIERANFLGELTRCFENTVTIAGTHGKTTTTSMVALCFLEALKDPSVQVGAILPDINGNYGANYDYRAVVEENWLFMGLYEWTISRVSNDNRTAFYIHNNGNVHSDYVNNYNAVRPVFYIIEEVQIFEGADGTEDNPYRIAI